MATAATRITLRHAKMPDLDRVKFTESLEESMRLNSVRAGAIIISASGMCNAGRIQYHLINNLYRPESCVIFVGYQAEGTLGRRLVEGAKQVKILGEDVDVRAKLYTLGGFSAHADRDGLLDWMSSIQNPKLKVFVVHGEEKSSLQFAGTIREKFGCTVHVPEWGEIINPFTMRSEISPYGVVDSYTVADHEIQALSESLATLTDKYNRAKEKNRLKNIKQLQEDINDVREMIALIINEL